MSTAKPAYKEVWFWAVFSPLLIIAAVCAVLLRFALVGADDRVTGEYYKEGRMINERFAAESLAQDQQVHGVAAFDRAAQRVEVTLEGSVAPDQVRLTLSHPAEQTQDRTYILPQIRPGHYRAPLSAMPSGRYYLLVEAGEGDAKWRVASEIDFTRADTARFGQGVNSLDVVH